MRKTTETYSCDCCGKESETLPLEWKKLRSPIVHKGEHNYSNCGWNYQLVACGVECCIAIATRLIINEMKTPTKGK